MDSAIARNIQHSLKCCQYENYFRNLRELYEWNELTNAINRVVEDMNHAFLLRVLAGAFKSHDFGRSAANLRSSGNDILDEVDRNAETYRLGSAQPGLRYAQADAFAEALMKDDVFGNLSLSERNTVLERIRNEIKGRMMEDIVLLETQLANPKKEVFALHFVIGEFDMVVFDPMAASCAIYEVKHSTEVVEAQYQHLIDEEKCKATEWRYGSISGKYVIYRGEACDVNGIHYLNVEEYLKSLT